MAADAPNADADADGDDPAAPPTRAAVRDALASVTDPELDRSVVELDYVDEVSFAPAEGGSESDGEGVVVSVAFVLPTAWCSPAFAWMMTADARDAVSALPGVTDCEVELREHMHAAEVNEGVNRGLPFAEAFPDAEDGIADLRATLDGKARLARQYDAVETLLDAGLSGEQVASLRREDVDRRGDGDRLDVYVRGGSLAVTVDADPVERYRRKAEETGLFEGSDRLFFTPEGDPIGAGEFETVHRRARLAGVNMDGQGGVCDALHRARQSAESDDEGEAGRDGD